MKRVLIGSFFLVLVLALSQFVHAVDFDANKALDLQRGLIMKTDGTNVASMTTATAVTWRAELQIPDASAAMTIDGTNASTTVALPGNLTVAGGASVTGNLDASGLVDGVDLALASGALSAHLASSTNPHGTLLTQTNASFTRVTVATTTAQAGYDLTVASGAYFGGAVRAGALTTVTPTAFSGGVDVVAYALTYASSTSGSFFVASTTVETRDLSGSYATDTGAITIPAAGWYAIQFAIELRAPSAAGQFTLQMTDFPVVAGYDSETKDFVITKDAYLRFTFILRFSAAGSYAFRGKQDSGGNVDWRVRQVYITEMHR